MLVSEAEELARGTQSESHLAHAHTLLGLYSSVKGKDATTAASYYAQAVITAWRRYPITDQRINHAILQHLRYLLRLGETVAARRICEHILRAIGEEVSAEHLEALFGFEEFSAKIPS